MRTVYLDNAATTPVDKEVLEAMLPFYNAQFGNPNSPHSHGRDVHVAVEDNREAIANAIGAEPSEIIFTSGGTESDNAAIKGVADAMGKNEIITTRIEHHAVLHPLECGKRMGLKPVYLDVDKHGRVTPEQVEAAITEDTALVSLMHVNNEIGTIHDLKAIGEVCQKHDVPFHSDTVQSAGKLNIDVNDVGVDLMSMSGHKIYGPKGIGILFVRNGTPWIPWMQGGSQERRRRGGTLNAPGIVGFGKAFELAHERMDDNTTAFKKLNRQLCNGLKERLGNRVRFNSHLESGVPHIVNVTLLSQNETPLDGEMLLLNLDMEGISVSNGSACTSGAIEPSHVLTNLGLSDELAKSSIRISMGQHNDSEDITYLLEKIEEVLDRMS